MKTLFASVLTVACILSLTSCSQKNSNTKVETSEIKTKYVSELEKSKMFTPVPISYDDKTKKLNIGEVTVSEGFPESLEEFIAPANETTYINSSATNQYFFVTKKSKKDIFSYYRNLWSKLGWKELKNPDIVDDTSISFENKKDNEMPPFEIITISTNISIPENLELLKLSGLYVEVVKEER